MTHLPVTIDKKAALLIATLASFLMPLVGSSINIALPVIGKELQIDAVLLSWVASSFLLSSAMFLVPFGRLADIYGRKKIFTIGITIYMIAAFLSAIAVNATQLIAFRILHGIGSAMISGTGVAIITSIFPPQERGKALGTTVAATYLGLSLGPFLGGLLVQHFGWPSIFLANVPPSLFIIILVFWRLKGEWAEARGEKFDLIGSALFSLTLVAIMYGVTELPATIGIWFIVIGFIGLYIFVKWEAAYDQPVLNINLFKVNRIFAFSNLAALINYSATFAVGFLLSLFLQYVKGKNPQSAGLILISQPIMMTICSPIAGRLSDRFEPRIVSSIGMSFTVVGLSLLTFLGENTSIPFIIASLIILGTGFGLFSSPNTNAVMSSVERKYYGVASGTVGTMRMIGMMLSLGIATFIFSLFIGRVQITPEYFPLFIKSVHVAFIIFAVLCFAGIFASLARGKVR